MKITSIIATILMVCLLLTACSGSGNSEPDASSDGASSATSDSASVSSGYTRIKLPSTKKPTSKNKVKIIYDPNGGSLCNGQKAYTYNYGTDFFTMGNTFPDNGAFIRDGYVLVGYSTKQSGGELIGIGHKFLFPEGATSVKLYCQWEKATEASNLKHTVLSDGTVKIDSYSGKEETVYIPRSINGRIVSTIASGAFKSNAVKTVYIPSGVTTVEENAFNCPKLTKLIMFDSVTKISDASLSGVKIKTIDLQMASFPRYEDAYSVKLERLVTSDKPCVVYMAGSSQHYALSSTLAEQILENKYTVVNCGTNAQINGVFYGEAITPLLGDDDILVYTPEQYAINTYWFAGNPELTEMTFRIFERSYECIKNVDLRNYSKLFESFVTYTKIRNRLDEQYFEVNTGYIDKMGDCGVIQKKLNPEDYHNDKNGTFRFCDNFFDASFIPNMNRMIDNLKAKGVAVYFSHPTYNKNACEPTHLNTASYNTYNNYLSKVIHCEVIGNVSDYIFGGQYFSNTDYHVNGVGREMHTKQAMEDLLAAIK